MGVASVKTNKIRWNRMDQQYILCDYGEIQDMIHLIICRNCLNTCSPNDLWNGKQKVVNLIWVHKL